MRWPHRTLNLVAAAALLLAPACSSDAAPASAPTTLPVNATPTTPAPTTSVAATTPQTVAPTTTVEMRPNGRPAPDWLGTRDLPLRPDDFGEIQPTPPELVDRQLWSLDLLPPPADEQFTVTVATPPPADVLARSTYRDGCPVTSDELSYLTVSFYGFDGLFHTGELLVNAEWTDGIVDIFAGLHAQRFPIEEMRVVTQAEQDAHPTGDGNNTSSFVCRTAVDPTRWSRHASGLAIDINPFHNPYVKNDLVLPELASAYVDRDNVRPGMIGPDQVALFDAIGWGWGGNWNSLLDHMHFSDNNR